MMGLAKKTREPTSAHATRRAISYIILSINSHDARPLLINNEGPPLARRRRLRPQST